MKVIIAGSRTIEDYKAVNAAVEESGFEITEVVSGCARGVDTLGERWALENSIPVKRFPADWKDLGKMAGYIRNTQMSNYGECLIALHDGISRGTAHMIKEAQNNDLHVYVKVI